MIKENRVIDEKDIQKKQEFWNTFIDRYETIGEIQNLQAFIALTTHTRFHQCKIILEVGCGTGLHQLTAAKSLLQPGATYVLMDNSDKMMEKLKAKFHDIANGYVSLPNNKIQIRTDLMAQLGENSYDLDTEIKKHLCDVSKDKLVWGCRGSNESIPFKDETFDCYIANLSLHLVGDHKKMLQEAFRVLKKGSLAGFTIWGRKENSIQFTINKEVLLRHNAIPNPSARTPFTLGENPIQLKNDVEEAGFEKVKWWYQPNYTLYRDGEEFFHHTYLDDKELYDALDKETYDVVKKEIIEEFNLRYQDDPKTFEIIVIIAEKH